MPVCPDTELRKLDDGLRHGEHMHRRISIDGQRGVDTQELAAQAEPIATSHASVATIVAVCSVIAGIMMQVTGMPLFTGWLTTGLWMLVPPSCPRCLGTEMGRR